MQTMPAFVYLLPAIASLARSGAGDDFFGDFCHSADHPADKSRHSPGAGRFGGSGGRVRLDGNAKLIKVQLPLAMPTIMAGINQSIMLSLSMVVTASLVGAPGIGADVYRAVTQVKVGLGFEAGLAIVILAIILDRLSQNIGLKRKKRSA